MKGATYRFVDEVFQLSCLGIPPAKFDSELHFSDMKRFTGLTRVQNDVGELVRVLANDGVREVDITDIFCIIGNQRRTRPFTFFRHFCLFTYGNS